MKMIIPQTIKNIAAFVLGLTLTCSSLHAQEQKDLTNILCEAERTEWNSPIEFERIED